MAEKRTSTRFLIWPQLLFLVFGCASSRQHHPFPSDKGVYHLVKRGENLWGIARDYGVEVSVLVQTNRLKDPSRIQVGQKLWIPGFKNKAKRSASIATPSKARTLKTGLGFIWPVKGQVSDRFRIEEKSKNNGINIAVSAGSYVLASMTGKVIFSGDGPGTYGNTIIINHLNGYVTVYAYNQKNLVVKGQRVNRGEKIALVGLGNSLTPTLHFEIRKDTVPRDPLKLLPPN